MRLMQTLRRLVRKGNKFPTESDIKVSMSIAIKRRASEYAPRIIELVSDIEIPDTVPGEVFPSTFTRLLLQFLPTFASCIDEFKNHIADSIEVEFVVFWGKLDTPSTNRAVKFEGEVSLVMGN